MKQHKNKQERPRYLKRKFASALCMLLIASLLLATTSYAWLVMSVAPEVTGITTNIGANGALEIALLNSETRQDMSLIKTMGGSLASRDPSANNTWGNVVDLGYDEYGLSEIVLWPARLNAVASGDGYVIDSGMLSVPTYGYDGRIVELTDNTVSALYNTDENVFSALLSTQDYGVRAIGTSDSLTVQGSALATAKSNINTYTNSAQNSASTALSKNGEALFDIVFMHATVGSTTYDDSDIASLVAVLDGIQSSLDYIDLALRQGLVAIAASYYGDEDTFTAVRDTIIDTTKELSEIIDALNGGYEVPGDYATWITELDEAQNSVNGARNACNALTGGSYTWDDISTPLNQIMNVNNIYINEDKFTDLSADKAMGLIGSDVTMTLAPGSGVLGDIADFTGDYTAWISYLSMDIEVTTATVTKPTYLAELASAVKDLEAADGTEGSEVQVDLTTTFGYALDLAFRCNASVSDLLLQTSAVQRVYGDSENERTMGGGSYMEFSTQAEDFGVEQMLTLMDAVRVAFIDDQGFLLGIAKLNTSNRVVNNGAVKAPLYLYGYEIGDDGILTMGERQKTDNVITSLDQNVAKAVTVLVWLDGDIVDNTMVAATEELSLSGNLNLQFASSANLVPADNNALLDITADKSDLSDLVETETETYDAGQGTYTTISWEAYIAAYEYANAVNSDASATETQIYNAAYDLALAKLALTEVSHDALTEKISQIRTMMGKTDDLARYVIKAEDGSYYTISEYTEDQLASLDVVGTIYRVDYANNLNDEGNDIKTPIYTDESWSALASALYEAEALNMNDKATDSEMDDVLTALDTAYDALQRKVFYLPYDYDGALYYFAVSSETDTYGKWYYSDFTRVVSDLLILKLDGNAEPATIAEIVANGYIDSFSTSIAPSITLLDEIYTELANEKIIAAKWTAADSAFYTEVMGSAHAAVLQKLIAKADELNALLPIDGISEIDHTEADELLARYNEPEFDNYGDIVFVTVEEANTAITNLQNSIAAFVAAYTGLDDGLMTADQRTLLTAAVNSAKTVNGYDDTANSALDELRTAVAAAEALLVSEEEVTGVAAAEALTALNTQLTANDMDSVTEANTLVYSIPVGSEVYEIVNAVELPGIQFALTGKTGSTTLEAIAVTESGVVLHVTKEVQIYTPAYSATIELTEDATTDEDHRISEDQSTGISSIELVVGESVDLSAYLNFTFISLEWERQRELGNVTDDDGVVHREMAEKYTWSSGSTAVASVIGKGSETCTLTATGVGTTTIMVTIETVQGNLRTASLTVTVTEPTT